MLSHSLLLYDNKQVINLELALYDRLEDNDEY